MKTLRVILWDQLSLSISSLKGAHKDNDIILLAQTFEDATYVAHHKKKLAFIFSAMAHFGQELQREGYTVDFTSLDDPLNTGSLRGEILRAISLHNPHQVVVTFPGEWRQLEILEDLKNEALIPLEILEDERFLCSAGEFKSWAKERKSLRMEFFYREMRRKYKILVDGDLPIGGSWNYDSENRKSPPKNITIPDTFMVAPSSLTQKYMKLIGEKFPNHFGELEPFHFAVTRSEALSALDQFIDYRLSNFGDYQDAMIEGEPWMFHSHLSFYINVGLLSPLECIEKAEDAFHRGDAPLNAVEGFIRQILGWREYVRGIYWLKMPQYAQFNHLEASRKLPPLYWGQPTSMNCLKNCVSETHKNAYAHHIQRLMVLGNFALLAGINPKEVNEWYLIVYADAFEWVELPNVTGMILFADGGYLGSKPYAASGKYIKKMSNYCQNCAYNPDELLGPNACPFNALYWDFFARHEDRLKSNQRLSFVYPTWHKFSPAKKADVRKKAQEVLEKMERGNL